MCELAGLPSPGETDGISYLPSLLGNGEQSQHEFLYWEFYERGGKQAVRMGNWKGVRLDVLADSEAPIELYDLSSDSSEKKNVVADYLDVVSRLAAIMQEQHVPTEHYSFPAKSRQDAGGAP